MIDLHAHILPGLDDGAKDMADTVAMARVAATDGIAAIAATSHSTDIAGRLDAADLRRLVAEVQAALAAAELDIAVYVGLENHLTPDLPQLLADGRALPLNDTRYVLVELPLQSYPIYTNDTLFNIQVAGYQPILAHPERNAVIMDDLSRLETLVHRGLLAQVTAASLSGDFGSRVRRVAEEMVRRRLVHIIASDAHAATPPRSPLLSGAVAVAARLIGDAAARAMVEATPRAIVAGQPVYVEPPLAESKRRSLAFWRR